MPDVMIGVIPSSISVPRLLASIIRNHNIGSELSEETMPYRGIWLMTRKMSRVTPVHIIFCWKGVLVSGDETSGIRGVKGFTRSKNRTTIHRKHVYASLSARAQEVCLLPLILTEAGRPPLSAVKSQGRRSNA